MKLVAKATIHHGGSEPARPGDTFELDEKKYPESIAQLLESGDAEKTADKSKSKDS
jgi:hypothetical protein